MPNIQFANIACGFHGGDPTTIDNSLALAAKHGVAVGAHPSYPDLEGFGRRSMQLSPQTLRATIHYQVGALEAMAAQHGLCLVYIKPHGALYNDAMRNRELRSQLFDCIATYRTSLPLVLQATPDNSALRAEAQAAGVELWLEAFADRAYTDDGLLQSRQKPGAVLETQQMLAQVETLVTNGCLTSVNGKALTIRADTLGVHGDNPQGVAGIKAVREMLDGVIKT